MENADDEFEPVFGSDNIFRDFNDPDAEIKHVKALLAARIIGVLDERQLSTRAAGKLVGVDQADIARIRNADLGRFTIDRLTRVLNRLDHSVSVTFKVARRKPARRVGKLTPTQKKGAVQGKKKTTNASSGK